jgi:hypothetical protein
MQDLQRDRLVVPKIVGEKYSSHAATPKLVLEAVALG